MQFNVGDIVRIKDCAIFTEPIGKIAVIESKVNGGRYYMVKFINYKPEIGECALLGREMEKISEKEALAWLI